MLSGFENVVPGSAERIIRMAEESHRARIEVERVPVDAEAFALRASTVGVSFLPWLIILLAGGLIIAGESAAGIIAGLVGVIAVGPQIIAATRRARG
ncbi:DUF2335 domain-containing protein [Pseudactinotalea sp. Z1732]|uniref:DUF2335 domain-containing protein n=1 Tax=Micrococcales TaxID=85006 RepID=UPI003C7CA87F